MERLFKHFTAEEAAVIGELSIFGTKAVRPKTSPRTYYFRSGFSFFGRGARFFAELRWMLFPLLVWYICRIARREKCQQIVGIFPDEFYCYAGCIAAKKMGMPFSSYFHNTYADNDAIDRRRVPKIQPELFSQSRTIFVMSDGMKLFFQEKYSLKNVVSLVHTFDRFPASPSRVRRDLTQQNPVKLVMFGNFNQSNLDATRRFIRAVASDSAFHISVYTHVPVALLKMRGIDTKAIEHMGYISDEVLIDELQKYDIMILTHGFDGAYGDVEYQTIFPTRTIPMLLSGKPILVHSPPESFLSNFIRQHQAGHLVDVESEALIRDGLRELVSRPQYVAELVSNARVAASQFHVATVIKILKEHLLLNEPPEGNYEHDQRRVAANEKLNAFE